MVASQVVISPKKASKGDNLWWPESKDEKYKGCGRCNGDILGERWIKNRALPEMYREKGAIPTWLL